MRTSRRQWRKGRVVYNVRRKTLIAVRQAKVVFLIVTLLAGLIPLQVYATTTQQQIKDAQKEKDALEGKLDQTNDNLEDLKGEQNSLQGKLSTLNAQLTEVSNNLEVLEQQMAEKEQEIGNAQTALEEAKTTEQWQYQCMKQRIRFMYESKNSFYLEVLLYADSFSDLLNAADYYKLIVAYDQKMLKEYEENREYIESEEARLFQELEELDRMKQSAEQEKGKVAGFITDTADSIAEYADQISDAEQKALDFEAEIKAKEEDLEYLQEKLEQEIAMSRKAANATWRDISEVSMAQGDRYLLANLIYCEAGGEPYAGQLAVGAVVVNRMLSSVFPDSIVGVIYQSGQFSPVASGRLELALTANKATDDCYRAADEALAGITNVGGCVYFRTPVEGLTGISIGGHIFY